MAGNKFNWLLPAAPWQWLLTVALLCAVGFGVALRTAWDQDIEYKYDEQWSYHQSQEIIRRVHLPWTGMSTSLGPPNPGASVWIFAGLARISGATSPPELARAVQLMNSAALFLLLGFALLAVPGEEREAWFWSVCLVAVNPLAVLLERKIWPPSTLPLFTMLLTIGWWYRGHRWGAMLWGATGMLIAEIHVPGIFLTLGFATWAALFQRRSVDWRGWLIGSLLAAIPALPWLWKVIHWTGVNRWAFHWENWWYPKFWLWWVGDSFGFGLDYTLGKQFPDFLAWPEAWGGPTYGMLAAHVLIATVAIVTFGRALLQLFHDRSRLATRLIALDSPTGFTIGAAMWGFGILMMTTNLTLHRHYMVVLFFFGSLWATRLIFRGFAGQQKLARALLIALFVGEGAISAGFLGYVHEVQVVNDEYGPTWKSQMISVDQP